MTMRRFSLIFLFLLAAILVACRPAATEPAESGPTAIVATAIPVTAVATATTAIAEQATAEVVEPTATEPPVATAAPGASKPDTEAGVTAALCPEFARPAMLLFLPGDDYYALFDLASGESCPLAFAEAIPGMVAIAQNDYFVASRTTGAEGQATVIRRYMPDGTVEELAYTMVGTPAGAALPAELVAFTVSDDARLIAWSVLGPSGGSDLPTTSLSIADLETGDVLGGVAPEVGEAPLALVPIRFSEDGSVLYHALQPVGLGGIWSSYVGRYHNLYAIATDGSGTPERIFDCADLGLGLCLGDFFVVDSMVTALAYVDREAGAVVIQNGAGEVLNTFKAGAEYVGYPTWGPGGELVYYAADLSDDPAASPLPEMGLLQRVAPPTAPAETLASDPALLLPVRFLNDTQVVAGWAGENDSRGLALVGVDGSAEVLDVPEGAMLLGVPAVSSLLGIPGSGGIVSMP